MRYARDVFLNCLSRFTRFLALEVVRPVRKASVEILNPADITSDASMQRVIVSISLLALPKTFSRERENLPPVFVLQQFITMSTIL